MFLIILSCLFLAKVLIELFWGPSFPIKLFFNDFRIDMKTIDVNRFKVIDLISSFLLSVLCVLLFLTDENYLNIFDKYYYIGAIIIICIITVALLQKTRHDVSF